MRYYSNSAVQTELTLGTSASGTNLSVSATTGFPGSVPFTLVLDPDTASEELVSVTAVAGTTLTVARGFDNTTGVAHDAGAVVRHVHSAADFRESREHEDSSTVHGVSGNVVGTSDVQALTNKDLSDPSNVFPDSLATNAEVSAEISTEVSAAEARVEGSLAAHTGAGSGVHGVTGAVVGTSDAQTLSNKTLDGSTNYKARIQSGTVDVSVSNATFGTVALTFPTAFASPPSLVVTSSSSLFWTYISNVTATGATVGIREYQAVSRTATVTVHWIAMVP